MASYIDIIGNLTKDPELKTFNQTTACDLSIASNTISKGRDGERKAVFFNVRVFGKHGEVCARYLFKGSKVYVRGEFFPVEYKTQDGQDRVVYTVNNAAIEFLTTGGTQQGGGAQQKTAPAKQEDENDLPF